jgi:hypothetical protein
VSVPSCQDRFLPGFARIYPDIPLCHLPSPAGTRERAPTEPIAPAHNHSLAPVLCGRVRTRPFQRFNVSAIPTELNAACRARLKSRHSIATPQFDYFKEPSSPKIVIPYNSSIANYIITLFPWVSQFPTPHSALARGARPLAAPERSAGGPPGVMEPSRGSPAPRVPCSVFLSPFRTPHSAFRTPLSPPRTADNSPVIYG